MTEYSEPKRKELETRKQLGPRLGYTTEKVARPGDFYGASGRVRQSVGHSGKHHPTRDSGGSL